ncbi:MAG: peptidyl-prolyl cis-trans isomerase [Candidatus Poribacteria bacterium]
MRDESYTLGRGKRPIFDRRTVFFSIIALVMFGVLVFLLIRPQVKQAPVGATPRGRHWTSEQQKKYANSLFSKGLKREAIAAYEKYLETTAEPGRERAKIAYRIGTMYMDLGEYEKALANFYRVEIEDPQTVLATDVGQKVVACLENLGMTSQAQYELEKRTAIRPEGGKAGKGGVVVAKIGKDEILMGEIDAALDRLPDWMRKQYQSGKGKLEFAKQYVANEVLYRKAKRLGLDKDPEMRLKIVDLTKSLLVQKVIEDELKKEVKINPADVELYYDANKDRYVEKAKVQLSFIKVDDKQKAERILTQLRSGKDFATVAKQESQDEKTKEKGGEIPGWITVDGYIPAVGSSEKIWKAIKDADKNGLTDVVEVDGVFYLFKVRDGKPERQKEFSEVKDQVEFDYRNFREQQATQALLERTLEGQEVEIYYDRFQ